jgi:hypothetical protein
MDFAAMLNATAFSFSFAYYIIFIVFWAASTWKSLSGDWFLKFYMYKVLCALPDICQFGKICQSEHWECELQDEVLSGSATMKNRSQALLMNLWFYLFL